LDALLRNKLLNCLPRARAAFYKRGFELPRLYLNAVEAVRGRTAEEFDYQYFLDQIVCEKIYLNGRFDSAIRRTLKENERSSYLDFLEGRDERAASQLSLDPNFNQFLKPDDVTSWKALFSKFKEQKQAEQMKYADHLARLITPAGSSLVKSILCVAEDLGYRSKHAINARSKTIELSDLSNGEELSTITVSELSELKKNGDIWVKYEFSKIPGKFFSFDDFIPGAYIYQGFNENPNLAIFSFFVQILFASILREELMKEF